MTTATENFRQQHEELMQLGMEILGRLQPEIVVERATEIRRQLGGIYGAFGNFTKKWPDADSIARNPVTFAPHTREVMKLLARRMTRETSELYPLLDGPD